MCTACCCRADICEEASGSAFLNKLLSKQGIETVDMDDRYGWLDVNGCRLEYGRPPICYSFYCDEVLQKLHDRESHLVAQVLGKLIHHIGQNALGGWHLVEIMDEHDLERINFDEIFQRLEEAQSAFEVIKQFVQSGRLSGVDRDVLALITTKEP